jgi:hypothetical protein
MRKRVKCGFSEENARFLGGKSHFIKYSAFGNERRNIHKTNKHSIAHTHSSHLVCTAFGFLQSNRMEGMNKERCFLVRFWSEVGHVIGMKGKGELG